MASLLSPVIVLNLWTIPKHHKTGFQKHTASLPPRRMYTYMVLVLNVICYYINSWSKLQIIQITIRLVSVYFMMKIVPVVRTVRPS